MSGVRLSNVRLLPRVSLRFALRYLDAMVSGVCRLSKFHILLVIRPTLRTGPQRDRHQHVDQEQGEQRALGQG